MNYYIMINEVNNQIESDNDADNLAKSNKTVSDINVSRIVRQPVNYTIK